jgi:hypothetical protein
LRFAREQQAKDARQQEVEGSVRRAQEFLRAQEYDRAIELLESILTKAPDDELHVVLEEAQRRRDDLNRQIAAAIAKGEQFMADGSAARALEFLQTQPTSFRRSDKFRELLIAAAQQPKAPEAGLVVPPPGQELESPEPAKTIMWDRAEAPEVEAPPAPRIPTTQLPPPAQAPPQKQLPKQPPKAPGAQRKFTQPQKIMAVAIAGALLLVVVVVVTYLKRSAAVGTLSVRTNVEGVDVFIDGKPKGNTNNTHELRISLDEGHHEIRVQKQGYAQLPSTPFDIAKNQESPVSFDLVASTPSQPEAATLAAGTLSVTANVEGFDVLVDDALSGTSPNKALTVHVSPGSHRIRLDKPGFGAPERKIDIVADKESSLTFTRGRSRSARPRLLRQMPICLLRASRARRSVLMARQQAN